MSLTSLSQTPKEKHIRLPQTTTILSFNSQISQVFHLLEIARLKSHPFKFSNSPAQSIPNWLGNIGIDVFDQWELFEGISIDEIPISCRMCGLQVIWMPHSSSPTLKMRNSPIVNVRAHQKVSERFQKVGPRRARRPNARAAGEKRLAPLLPTKGLSTAIERFRELREFDTRKSLRIFERSLMDGERGESVLREHWASNGSLHRQIEFISFFMDCL